MSFNAQTHSWGAWSLNPGHKAVSREWVFETFGQAVSFMQQVAEVAHALDHHPEIHNTYNRLRLTLSTHDAGGLTERDAQVVNIVLANAAFENANGSAPKLTPPADLKDLIVTYDAGWKDRLFRRAGRAAFLSPTMSGRAPLKCT